jgi:uncharacterized protein
MLTVTFHFHGDLNDFLPREQRQRDLVTTLPETAAVKHPIEALGVPHPEVAAIVVNSRGEGFEYAVADGDDVHVFPMDAEPPLASVVLLRPPLSGPVRFVLDAHLGVLASYLRLLGFDALYRNDYDDRELAEIAAREGRVLLTRDRGLLKRKIVTYGYCIRETEPRRQIVSVVRRFKLAREVHPWRRCLRCNGLLEGVDKAVILHRLQPKTQRYYDTFQRCTACDRIYWQGSHYARLEEMVEEVRKMASENCETGN